jgi:periodic tryptophan protein 2
VFDLVKYVRKAQPSLTCSFFGRSESYTLPFAHRRNIARLALNPRGNLLLSVDEDGRAILTNVPRRIVLYHFSLRGEITALAFSPSGRHFAVGLGRQIEVWHTPSTPDVAEGDLEFAPFVRHRVYTGHYDAVQSLEWSSDSRFFLSASKDLTARIWSIDQAEGNAQTTLTGHKQGIVGAWFSKDQETIYTVSKDGALFVWKYMLRYDAPEDADEDNDENLQWGIAERHFFQQNNAHITCAGFHPESKLLVTGFSHGLFFIHELPEFAQIQNLSISQNDIDHVAINKTGEWLAFGASKLGQLLVWEWQSESYVLKQQGHFDSMNTIAYSPDGQ